MRLLDRRTARLRLTALYGLLFLLTGAGLLLLAGLLTVSSTSHAQSVPAPGAGQATASQLARDQARIGQLQRELAAADQARQPVWHTLVVGSVVALGIMAAVSVLLGWFVANRVLRPLRTMTAATRRISADNLHERLAVPGPVDEVKDLADTIDELLERLQGAFAAQRRFVANASHELRTPLATMRASLDVAEAKPEPAPPQTTALAARLRAELDQIDRLLEGLLVLARAQHGDLPGHATLSLDAVAAAALAARSGEISRAGRVPGRRDRRGRAGPVAGAAAGPALPPARRGRERGRQDRLRPRRRARAVDRRRHRRGPRRDPGPVRPGRGRPAGTIALPRTQAKVRP